MILTIIPEDEQVYRCEYTYRYWTGKEKACGKSAKYRIGLSIFLCGIHCPGVGRYPVRVPAQARADTPARGQAAGGE